MKRFLLNASLFAILIGIILWVPQILFDRRAHSDGREWPFSYLNHLESWQGDTTHRALLVCGNSRGGHYDVPVLQELYPYLVENMSMAGSSFDFQYHVMLSDRLCEAYRPRYIVQEISPFCFFAHLSAPLNVDWLPYIHLPELEFLREYNPGVTVYDRLLPVKYRGNVDKVWKRWQAMGEYAQSGSEREAAIARLSYNAACVPCDIEDYQPSLIHLFDTFIRECDSLGITLILAISPIHTGDGYPLYDWEGFRRIIDSLTVGRDIPILDYSHFYGNDTAYFRDPVHLTQYGREQYSRKFMHDMDSMRIIPRACPTNPLP